MRGYREQIADLVDRLLGDVQPGEPFDLVRQLAMPVPVGVICTLMGIDGADIRKLARYGQVVGVALSGRELTQAQVDELDAAKDELSAMFARLADERAADPRDDVISHLVQAMPDRITPYELMVTTRLLLIAGFETTVNLIGNATHALLSDRAAWQAFVDDPGLAPQVVEEALRYDPPVQSTGRVITEDLVVDGATIPAGSWVTTLIASANRDETVFADPDRFDPQRANADDHLAFSGGIHYCLGAPLARLEGEVALAGLVTRFPGLELAGPGDPRASTVIRGFARLPVVSR
jgi:cytochrome P450